MANAETPTSTDATRPPNNLITFSFALAGGLPLEALGMRLSYFQRGIARLASGAFPRLNRAFEGSLALNCWRWGKGIFPGVQPMFVESLDSYDGIRNSFRLFSFLEFFEFKRLRPPLLPLGSSAL
jgi:hypothetical protein